MYFTVRRRRALCRFLQFRDDLGILSGKGPNIGEMMKRTLIAIAGAVTLTAFSAFYFLYLNTPHAAMVEPVPEEASSGEESVAFVAPGEVEPLSEEIEIGAELPGKLKEVLVEEGDAVRAGQALAVLENSDLEARVESARARIETLLRQKRTAAARVDAARADRIRIANAARPVERKEARSRYEETLPAVAQARSEYERRKRLFDSGDVSRESMERARTELESAERLSASRYESYNVVNAGARHDDLARADAAIRLEEERLREFEGLIDEARAEVRISEESLLKTIIKSPIDGIVLRKRANAGESVTPESPLGVVTVGDASAVRVRVDVDETDVGKVREGARVYVRADAFGEKRFSGKVVEIGSVLGRKNIRTDEPVEKVDTKILEVLVELDPGQQIPFGLRVDTYFLHGDR